MKQEYKFISTIICFLLVFSIYIVRWMNEGHITGFDDLFRVPIRSKMDRGTGQMQTQNRPGQEETSEHVQVVNRHLQSQPNAFDVILSAYKHSGSSITGKVLSSRDDAFYVYEPLWKLLKNSFYKGPDLRCPDTGKYCLNLTQELSSKTYYIGGEHNKTSRFGESHAGLFKMGINRLLNETLSYLQSIFLCSFHHYSYYLNDPKTNTLLDGLHSTIYFKGKKWRPFRSCVSRNAEPYNSCWKEAEAICRAAKRRVIKLLRMSLDNLASLLHANSRLKVVYLYRDPRGIYNSQHKDTRNVSISDKNFNKTRLQVETMCNRMQWDITAAVALKTKFPERVKFIQYENLGNLTEIGRDLYAFLGMSYSSKNQEKLIKMSNPPGSKGFHPLTYRTNLSWDVVSLFETECSEVLDKLGFTRYKSEKHLRDLSQSGFVQKNTLSSMR